LNIDVGDTNLAEITFTLKLDSKIAIEAESICPDQIAGKTLDEIGELPVWRGNKELKLCDLFDISGETVPDPADLVVHVISETPLKRIGQGMSTGKIIIEGNAGMHLAQDMSGGEVVVNGDVDDWAFSQMTGGTALVNGNAGHYLGAAGWGEWRGNSGGTITVEGDTGNEVGAWFSGGTIEIKGNANEFVGVHMKKGTIIVHGTINSRVGGQMTGGQIILFTPPEAILSGFKLSEDHLESVEVNGTSYKGPFNTYIGDHAERKKPKGALIIRTQ